MNQMPNMADVIVSLLIGVAAGWFFGGIYNLINGRTFNGHQNKGPR